MSSATDIPGFIPGACIAGAGDDIAYVDGRRCRLERVRITDLETWRERHGLRASVIQPDALAGVWPPHVLYEVASWTA